MLRRTCLPLVLVLACLPLPAVAAPCPFGVSPATARRVFDRLQQLAVGDGYRFEGLGTNKSEIVVQWSRDGQDCPAIRGQVDTCWSPLGLPTFQLDVPAELAARCPGLQVVVQELSPAVAPRPTVNLSAIVLILVAALVIRRVGWIAIIGAAPIPLLFNPDDALTVGLGAAWLVFAALLCGRETLPARRRAEKLALVALVAVALLLNWWLSSGGPGDLRMNLAAIWSSELELRWGPAPIALFRLLGAVLGGIRDTEIRWCNLVLSSLLPLLLYGIVAELGVRRAAALAAAFVVAAHPLLIVFSGVLERPPAYLFAACGALLALIGFLQRGSWDRFTAFVLGAVLATTSRPEGAHVFVLYLAVVLLGPAARWPRRVALLALLCLLPLAFAYLRVVGSKPPSGYPLMGRAPLLWTVLFDPDFTPLAWIVAWTLGLVIGVFGGKQVAPSESRSASRRAAWVALASLLGLHIVWSWGGMYQMFVGHLRQVASLRYEVILVVPFAIGMALFIQAVLHARAPLKAALVVACLAFTAATYPRCYDTLLRPFTIDYEYRFLRQQALTLPPSARLYVLDAPLDDIGLIDARLVGQFAGSPVSFANWSERRCDAFLHDASPAYLYIGSSCAELVDAPGRQLSPDYARWWQDCASMRARVAADVVEQIEVPARKTSWHEFRERTVPLALYRLADASICALGPRSAPRESKQAQP